MPGIFRTFDYFFCVIAAALVCVSAIFVYSARPENRVVTVRSDTALLRYSEDSGDIVNAEGPLGITTVEVRGGRARILSSPCANQSCVRQGEVALPGQFAACLPNHVMVAIEGSDAALDAVVR